MKEACDHTLDEPLVIKKLYFSMQFSKLWNFHIHHEQNKYKIFICMHCFNVFVEGEPMNNHIRETGHYLRLTFIPFALTCNKCNAEIPCPELIIKYASLALPLMPSKTLTNGFHNLGNSCFSSSVLVALTHCIPLVKAAVASSIPLCRIIAAAATRSRFFNQIVHDWMPEFPAERQADASEFLLFLLEKLSEDPLIAQLFNGQISQRRYCKKCSKAAQETQGFSVMYVPLVNDGWENCPRASPAMPRSFGLGKIWGDLNGGEGFYSAFISVLQHGDAQSLSLDSCLASSFLSSPGKCSECKKESCVCFQTLDRLPEILILQLERFGKRWFGVGKLHQFVNFPLNDVDFSHFVPPHISCGPSKYDLTAVISHLGFMEMGHYTCYARNEGRWFYFNDTEAKEVPEKEVLKCQAYLLFYTKRETDDVLKVREKLSNAGVPWEQWLPISIFSDPAMWGGSIMHGDFDEVYEEASVLADASVLRESTDSDIRRTFTARFPWGEGDVYITKSALDASFDFLEEKGKRPVFGEGGGDYCVGSNIILLDRNLKSPLEKKEKEEK